MGKEDRAEEKSSAFWHIHVHPDVAQRRLFGFGTEVFDVESHNLLWDFFSVFIERSVMEYKSYSYSRLDGGRNTGIIGLDLFERK